MGKGSTTRKRGTAASNRSSTATAQSQPPCIASLHAHGSAHTTESERGALRSPGALCRLKPPSEESSHMSAYSPASGFWLDATLPFKSRTAKPRGTAVNFFSEDFLRRASKRRAIRAIKARRPRTTPMAMPALALDERPDDDSADSASPSRTVVVVEVEVGEAEVGVVDTSALVVGRTEVEVTEEEMVAVTISEVVETSSDTEPEDDRVKKGAVVEGEASGREENETVLEEDTEAERVKKAEVVDTSEELDMATVVAAIVEVDVGNVVMTAQLNRTSYRKLQAAPPAQPMVTLACWKPVSYHLGAV